MATAPIAIGDLAEGVRGVSYKPEQLRDDANDGSYYLLRSNNIQNGTVTFEDVQIVDKTCVRQKQQLREGDIIVCMSNGSRQLVGKNALVKTVHGNYCVGAFCSAFRVKDGINPQFVFQVFQSEIFKQKIDIILSGSAINNLRNKQIEEIKFDLPSDDIEKTHIAEILRTVDEAVAATEALIAKYSRIKTGLMQDLLTRGIDEAGAIRSKATHRFVVKNGMEVPEEWEVDTLRNRCKVQGGKRLPKGHNYTADNLGLKYLRVLDFYEKRIEIDKLENIPQATFKMLERYEVTHEQVVISIAGSIGFANKLKQTNNVRIILTENALKISPDESVNADFLCFLLNSNEVQNQIWSEIGTGGGVPKLALHRVEGLRICIPPIHEQLAIISSIQNIDSSLKQQFDSLSKLTALKNGLMQDLLTGKVRVKIETLVTASST